MTASASATLAFNNVSGMGRSGTGTFKVDGKVVATQKLEHTVPLILPWDETFDIGFGHRNAGRRRRLPGALQFTGKIDKLTFAIDQPKLTPEDNRSSRKRSKAPPTASRAWG